MTTSPIVDLERVSKSFADGTGQVHAVRDVSLVLGPGELVVLQGRSGSGKTTLLRLVAGLLAASGGSVTVGDVHVSSAGRRDVERLRRTTVGMVFQDHNLIDELTAGENVALPLIANGESTARASILAAEALGRVGLQGLEDRFPGQLSGGQCQRVGIARAVVGAKPLLLADEPTGALDSENSHALFKVMQDLVAGGTTVLLSTHDPLAMGYATRVLSMSDGELVGGFVDD